MGPAAVFRALHSFVTYFQRRVWLKPADFSGGPQLTYAGVLPKEGAIASGGTVKLTKLAQLFPECGRNANILYLVSSALPVGAVAWARAVKKAGGLVVLNQNGVAYPAWASVDVCERVNRRNQTLLGLSDFVFFQSQFCRLSVEKWVGRREGNYDVLPNPVDVVDKPFAHANKDFPLLVVAGSHHHPLRILRALEAIAELSRRGQRAHLRIAGKLAWPGARTQIEQYARDLKILDSIEISGPYAQANLSGVFGNADILLHLQDKDASPTVPLEAMSFGLGVVGPKSGALPELVPAQCGKLIPVGEGWDEFFLPSGEQIADAVLALWPIRAGQRQASLDWVREHFRREQWLDRHNQLFSRILEDRRKGQM